jgi:glucosamine 6-phosphate synthetase-like amidotransferase/phosphosugar isomerase protein
MCGQAGLILGKKRRTDAEIAILKTVFSGLLMRSEIRGKHASGVAMVDQDGEYRLFKRPMSATQLLAQPGYADALGTVEGSHGRFAGRTTLILGHTRRRTCGDEANNHPLRAADWLGTFNGAIYNATRLFRRHRLYRHAEVDSELILRLADKFADIGTLDVPRFIDALRSARGQLSAVFASLCAPETIYVLHGNRPLVLRAHRGLRVIAYASEGRFLDAVLGDLRGWRDFVLSPMTLACFHREDILHPQFYEVDFIAQERRRSSIEAKESTRRVPV